MGRLCLGTGSGLVESSVRYPPNCLRFRGRSLGSPTVLRRSFLFTSDRILTGETPSPFPFWWDRSTSPETRTGRPPTRVEHGPQDLLRSEESVLELLGDPEREQLVVRGLAPLVAEHPLHLSRQP